MKNIFEQNIIAAAIAAGAAEARACVGLFLDAKICKA